VSRLCQHEPVDARSPADLLRRAGWWIADYLYAGGRQLAVLGLPWLPGRVALEPASWRAGRDDLPEVVLIPGVYEHWSFLRPLGDALTAAGHRVVVVHGLGANLLDIPETARRLDRALARCAVPPAGRVLVAHSKGGLVGKSLLVTLGDAAATERGLIGLVAVSTPFAGSKLARLFLDPRIRDFSPRNRTIVQLGGSQGVNGDIVSIFGPFDPHIPEGSALPGATNVEVPVAGHFRPLGAASTHRAVVEGIALLAHRAG